MLHFFLITDYSDFITKLLNVGVSKTAIATTKTEKTNKTEKLKETSSIKGSEMPPKEDEIPVNGPNNYSNLGDLSPDYFDLEFL